MLREKSSVCVQNWLLSLGRAKFECQDYLKLFFYVTFLFYAHLFRNKKADAQSFTYFHVQREKKSACVRVWTI